MPLLLELSARFPFVRRHRCVTVRFAETEAAPLPSDSPHLTWVMTDAGLGFLHHHADGGWIIQLLGSGALIRRTTDEFTHAEAP